MSDMSSSEKPEFCLPNLRGSTTFCVAVEVSWGAFEYETKLWTNLAVWVESLHRDPFVAKLAGRASSEPAVGSVATWS